MNACPELHPMFSGAHYTFLLDFIIIKGKLSPHTESHHLFLGFMYLLVALLSTHVAKLGTSKWTLTPNMSLLTSKVVSQPLDFIP